MLGVRVSGEYCGMLGMILGLRYVLMLPVPVKELPERLRGVLG